MKRVVFAISLSIALIGCGVNEEEYLKHHEEGVEASKSLNQEQCLSSAIEKVSGCSSIECSVNTNGYLRGCLSNAEKIPKICEGVPEDEGAFENEQWRAEKCNEAGVDPARCDILFSTLQKECS
ncbi:hypothetical protein [Marinobacter daepoensis]|uniref:hypothetical protein n=1 Tax=Marinobacter daepoensis TaxID=262077 RepID=UPI0004217902|nr:hypothetical protein [Marinobacter daepoensis]